MVVTPPTVKIITMIIAMNIFRHGYRYELETVVSDRVWRQDDISANVTVVVQLLDAESLSHAVPLTLEPVTARDLTHGWNPKVR